MTDSYGDKMQALDKAERRLVYMMDAELEESGEVPDWLHAAHAAVLTKMETLEWEQAHG